MRSHPAAVIAAAALLLAACASTPEPQRIVVPEIVTVPVREYVPVPDALTRPCPEARAAERTVQAVVEAYNANILALRQCNRQLRLIKALEDDAP